MTAYLDSPWPGEDGTPKGFVNAAVIGVLAKMGYTNIETVETEWGGLIPGLNGAADRLQLFVESADLKTMNMADNITIAPWGHLIVCEDQYTAITDNHLRGITPAGTAYALARCRRQTELGERSHQRQADQGVEHQDEY